MICIRRQLLIGRKGWIIGLVQKDISLLMADVDLKTRKHENTKTRKRENRYENTKTDTKTRKQIRKHENYIVSFPMVIGGVIGGGTGDGG
jgi:beta-lactamase regulating signal transducer with metallopeptidase domain